MRLIHHEKKDGPRREHIILNDWEGTESEKNKRWTESGKEEELQEDSSNNHSDLVVQVLKGMLAFTIQNKSVIRLGL